MAEGRGRGCSHSTRELSMPMDGVQRALAILSLRPRPNTTILMTMITRPMKRLDLRKISHFSRQAVISVIKWHRDATLAHLQRLRADNRINLLDVRNPDQQQGPAAMGRDARMQAVTLRITRRRLPARLRNTTQTIRAGLIKQALLLSLRSRLRKLCLQSKATLCMVSERMAQRARPPLSASMEGMERVERS